MAPTLRNRKGKQPAQKTHSSTQVNTRRPIRKRTARKSDYSSIQPRSKRAKVDNDNDTIERTKEYSDKANSTVDAQFDRKSGTLNSQQEMTVASGNSDEDIDDDEDCNWESVDIPSSIDRHSIETATEDTISSSTINCIEDSVLSSTGDIETYMTDTDEQPVEEHRIYNDVQIIVEQESNRPATSLGKGMSAYEREYLRQLREWVHHSHVTCLTAHYKLRNTWCNQVHYACRSIMPPQLTAAKATRRTINTIDFLKSFVEWWREDNQFIITGPGLLTRPYDLTYLKGYKTLKDWMDAHVSDEDGDFIPDKESFIQLKQGTRDTSAELFVAMLRACGVFEDVRLVCSLQPVPYRIPAATKLKQTNSNNNNNGIEVAEKAKNINSASDGSADKVEMEEEQEESTSNKRSNKEKSSEPKFAFRKPAVRPGDDPNTVLKIPTKSANKPPTVWAEVYCNTLRRWVTVDPIRGFIDQPLSMEPNHKARDYQLSYVLAYDQCNRITDVTRRYTAQYDKALLARERPLTKREKEAGMLSWSDLFLTQLCHRRFKTDRDEREQEELAKRQAKEVMPTVLSKFKDHPLYALERHLLTYEVIYPKTKDQVLGSIRGEAIYPRKNVKAVRTAESFHKMGRMIKTGEQPIKMVKARAVTKEKKRLKAQAKQAGEDLMVACYGEWQTEPYVPPPVKDGKIPKNQYNNIDLFTPSMLPKGAVHLPLKGVASVAKKLGIDYADAVVDFEFHKMRAVPVVDGIVVAEENKWLVLEAWEDQEQRKAIKAIQKQEKESVTRWRKLIKTVLIHARVDRDYGKRTEPLSTTTDKWADFVAKKQGSDESIEKGLDDDDDDGGGGGGFILE